MFLIFNLHRVWVALLVWHPLSKFAHRHIPHPQYLQEVSGHFFCDIPVPNLLTTVCPIFNLHRKWVAPSFVTSLFHVCSLPCSHLQSPQQVSGLFFCDNLVPNLLTAVFSILNLHREWVAPFFCDILTSSLLTTMFPILKFCSLWVATSFVTFPVPSLLTIVFSIFNLHSSWVVCSFVTSLFQVCSPPCSLSSISTESGWPLLLWHPHSKFSQCCVHHLQSPQRVSSSFFYAILLLSLLTIMLASPQLVSTLYLFWSLFIFFTFSHFIFAAWCSSKLS